MKTWLARPKEEAYLFNPAFCCTTLSVAMQSYASVKDEGVPFPLAFMFLPIVLHKPTRESLPANIRTSMAAWIQENSEARVLFYERLVSLKPHTREAIQFGMLLDWILPRNGGLLETTLTNADVERTTRMLSNEARECVMRAKFVGKWFAKAGATHTSMAFWGVRP
jgi:ABC-three component (ABC-3C) system Middle Component 3